MPRDALPNGTVALAAAPLYLFAQDRDLRYTWAPRVPPELAERLDVDVIGHTDLELFGPAMEPVVAIKREVMETGVGTRVDVPMETADGTAYYDVTLAPVREQDEVIGITGVAFDVTHHHRIAADLRRAQARMAEAEELARIGSWEWDVEEDRIRWSPGLFHIYGIKPDDLDPRFAARQRDQRVHPDDHERVERAITTALQTGRPFEMDYRILRPDGRVRVVHGRCEAVLDDAGKVVRLLGTAQDVTEMRLAEDALEKRRTSWDGGHSCCTA
jgi:PAS domain S-box-containing protein